MAEPGLRSRLFRARVQVRAGGWSSAGGYDRARRDFVAHRFFACQRPFPGIKVARRKEKFKVSWFDWRRLLRYGQRSIAALILLAASRCTWRAMCTLGSRQSQPVG